MTVWSELAPTRACPPVVVRGGFLARTICRTVELAQEPLTAFEIATRVLRPMPNRWARSTVCRKVYELERRKMLQVAGEGFSPDGAVCWCYEAAR